MAITFFRWFLKSSISTENPIQRDVTQSEPQISDVQSEETSTHLFASKALNTSEDIEDFSRLYSYTYNTPTPAFFDAEGRLGIQNQEDEVDGDDEYSSSLELFEPAMIPKHDTGSQIPPSSLKGALKNFICKIPGISRFFLTDSHSDIESPSADNRETALSPPRDPSYDNRLASYIEDVPTNPFDFVDESNESDSFSFSFILKKLIYKLPFTIILEPSTNTHPLPATHTDHIIDDIRMNLGTLEIPQELDRETFETSLQFLSYWFMMNILLLHNDHQISLDIFPASDEERVLDLTDHLRTYGPTIEEIFEEDSQATSTHSLSTTALDHVEENTERSLIGRARINHQGIATQRRASAQTGDVIFPASYFDLLYVQKELAKEALHFAVGIPAKAGNLSLYYTKALGHKLGGGLRALASEFYQGFSESLFATNTQPNITVPFGQRIEANSADTLPRALQDPSLFSQLRQNPAAAGARLGSHINTFATHLAGAARGLTAPTTATAPPLDAPLSAASGEESLISQVAKDPAAAGARLGRNINTFAIHLASAARGLTAPTTATAPPVDAPLSAASSEESLISQVAKDPAAAGARLGRNINTFANHLAGAASGLTAPSTATAPPVDAPLSAASGEESFISQVIKDPAAAGAKLGEDARKLALGAVKGFVKGKEQSASEAEESPGVFVSFLDWIKQAAFNQTTSLALLAVSTTLKDALHRTSNLQIKEQISDLITEIDAFQNKAITFEQLKENITRIVNGKDASGNQIRDFLQVHCHGLFPIPLRNESADTSTSKSVLSQIIESQPRVHAEPDINFEAGIPIMRDRVVANITSISSIKLINDYVCLGLIEDKKISRILQGERNDNFDKETKARLFKEIDSLDVSWLRKTIAKMTYTLTSTVGNFFMNRFLKALLKKIDESTNVQNSSETQNQHNGIMQSVNDFLSVLKGTIKRVNNDPSPTADPETMAAEELCKPMFNSGMTQNQLYAKSVTKAVDDILPSFGWTQYLNDIINKLPKAAAILLKVILSPVFVTFFISEKLMTFFVKQTLKALIIRSQVIQAVVDKSVGQISRNGYTHSLNKYIYAQLQQIWQSLDDLQEEPASLTLANKEELKKFVHNIHEILQASKISAHDPSIIDKVKATLMTQGLDIGADTIALIIDKSKNKLLDPALMPLRKYTLLESINNALESEETATLEEMSQLEDDIQHLAEQILNRATKKAIHQKIHSGPFEIEKTLKKYQAKLQQHLQEFYEDINQAILRHDLIRAQSLVAMYSQKILELQQTIESDASSEGYASIFDKTFISPAAGYLASILETLSASTATRCHDHLSRMKEWMDHMPNINHVNAEPLTTVNHIAETLSQRAAFKISKDLFEEAWRLFRKPYVWKAAINRGLLNFVK